MRLPDELGSLLSSIWAPKERMSALEWAQANVVLDKRFTVRPGRYDVAYTPYLAGPHEWFSDPKVRQITLVKAAQLGGTTWLANCMMFAIAEDPGPILYVTSTGDNAKSWSERELIPRLKACEALRPYLPQNEDDFRKTEMHFTTATLKLVGSNSEGNLASRPVRWLFCDEVDKWPPDNVKEAPALELAKARTIFYRHVSKAVLTSTPTVESGAIWQEYLRGSQHKFLLRCPDCGEWQPLVFEQVKWPAELKDLLGDWHLDEVEKAAWYECRKCGARWEQKHQHEMVRGGRWEATNPKAPADHVSAHISSLYSPRISWGAMARMFLQKKDSAGGLHDFYNNYLGLPWAEAAAEVEEGHVAAHRKAYELGSCPVENPVAILLGADYHQAFVNYVVRAFAANGESWLLDYGRFIGLSDLLDWAASREYGGRRITGGLIDSGYSAQDTYQFCLDAGRRGLRVLPSKGSAEKFTSKPVRLSDMSLGGKTYRRSLVIYGDDEFKRMLYLDVLRDGKLGWWIPTSAGRDYTDELMRERLVIAQNKRGYEEPVWKRTGANHYGDAEKLCLVQWATR